MSIYIARGDDTLGPYTPAEVANLIRSGVLSPDDYAARDGDPAWAALASFLPTEAAPVPVADVPIAVEASRLQRPSWLAAAMIAAVVVALPVSIVTSRNTRHPRRQPDERPRPTAIPPAPVASAKLTVAPTSAPPPEVVEKGGLITGTISLDVPDGPANGPAAVRVSVYPLKVLEPYLAQKKASEQAELDRLATQIEAARAELATRAAAEQSALQAVLKTDPSDDLIPSLQFAHEQAKKALLIAQKDFDYFLDQRRELTQGGFFFRDLPAPLAVAETDPAGGFTLDLPPGGPFAVAACARQATPEGGRQYYWLVKVSLTDASQKTLSLSTANVASAGAAESLIQTAD